MSRAAAPALAEKYIPVGRGRLCRNLKEQVTHPATVIGRMVDDVHEDLAARHRARLTGHESKCDAFLETRARLPVAPGEEPVVHLLLRRPQCLQVRVRHHVARREPMREPFLVRMPDQVHYVAMS